MIKKLFAYSGNRCAVEGCKEELVDKGGTMLGKIAHIHAAKGGSRFDASMTDEQRRDIKNLIVVCGKHHDIIDDPERELEFPAKLLKAWKKKHEARFIAAEKAFVATYRDVTDEFEPTYPKNLKALAKALNEPAMKDCPDDIEGIAEFITKLRSLPPEVKDFALTLARRMRKRGNDELPIADVTSALDISEGKLKRLLDQLEDHRLGGADEKDYRVWVAAFWPRSPGGNPFTEMLEFCDATGADIDDLYVRMNFALYDKVP